MPSFFEAKSLAKIKEALRSEWQSSIVTKLCRLLQNKLDIWYAIPHSLVQHDTMSLRNSASKSLLKLNEAYRLLNDMRLSYFSCWERESLLGQRLLFRCPFVLRIWSLPSHQVYILRRTESRRTKSPSFSSTVMLPIVYGPEIWDIRQLLPCLNASSFLFASISQLSK